MHFMHTNRSNKLMKYTERKIDFKNRLILYVYEFNALAYDIITKKAFRIFTTWKDYVVCESTMRYIHRHTYKKKTCKKSESKGKWEQKTDTVERKTNLIRKLCSGSGKSSWMCYLVSLCVCCGKQETDMNKVLDFGIVFVAIASGHMLLQTEKHI